MEELYKDKDTKCIKNCGGRETGSERIDTLCNRAYVKHGEKLHYKQLQDAKENPDLCSRCQLATSCQQPEEPVDECPDFKSLCKTCHVVDSCPERDDKKVSCDGHVPEEDVKVETRPALCRRCAYEKTCSGFDLEVAECTGFLHYDDRDIDDNAQAVTESNKEAAESVKGDLSRHCSGCLANNGNCSHILNDTISDCIRVQRLVREDAEVAKMLSGGALSGRPFPLPENPSHAKALDRCESTKKACEESIGYDPKALTGDID
jgi:hypothetical protein